MHTVIGLLSDAHGNGLAFDRAVELLRAQGAERLYFLGDAVGYVPSVSVLDSLARLGDQVCCIRGNHEAMLLDGQSDAELERVYQLESLRPMLTREHLAMIASWPVSRTEVIDDQKMFLVHGSPTNPTYGYVYPDTDLAEFALDADWVLMANTHRPFIRKQAKTLFVNIGSCGMPRDDGRYGSVALLDAKARSVRIIRFNISDESSQVLEQFPSVHPSVRSVFERRSPAVIGDLQ